MCFYGPYRSQPMNKDFSAANVTAKKLSSSLHKSNWPFETVPLVNKSLSQHQNKALNLPHFILMGINLQAWLIITSRKSWKDWTDLHICFLKSSSFSQLSKTDHEVKWGFEHYYLEALNLTDPFRTNTNPVVLENYIKPLLWPQTPVSTHTGTFTVCFILLVSPTCLIHFDLSDATHTKHIFCVQTESPFLGFFQ